MSEIHMGDACNPPPQHTGQYPEIAGLEWARLNDAAVAAVWQLYDRNEISYTTFLEKAVVLLAEQKWRLLQEAVKLEMLTPKAYRLPDGTVMRYDATPELVPVVPLDGVASFPSQSLKTAKGTPPEKGEFCYYDPNVKTGDSP